MDIASRQKKNMWFKYWSSS